MPSHKSDSFSAMERIQTLNLGVSSQVSYHCVPPSAFDIKNDRMHGSFHLHLWYYRTPIVRRRQTGLAESVVHGRVVE